MHETHIRSVIVLVSATYRIIWQRMLDTARCISQRAVELCEILAGYDSHFDDFATVYASRRRAETWVEKKQKLLFSDVCRVWSVVCSFAFSSHDISVLSSIIIAKGSLRSSYSAHHFTICKKYSVVRIMTSFSNTFGERTIQWSSTLRYNLHTRISSIVLTRIFLRMKGICVYYNVWGW